MEFVKKSINERELHKREYDNRVNERQMQINKGKVDMSNALDASLVVIESNGTKSRKHNTSSSSGDDADADDADIKLIYDKEPMAKTSGGTLRAFEALVTPWISSGIDDANVAE
ncbi:hypothetical protein Tco_0046967 [Tanacetum coccineum]